MNQLRACLIRHGAYRFGPVTLTHTGRISPYIVKDPVPRPEEYLKELGLASVDLDPFDPAKEICLVGIASSGLGLSHALCAALNSCGKASRVIDACPRSNSITGSLPTPLEKVVLVDNAVTTGATVSTVFNLLADRKIEVTEAVRVFDREDVNSDGKTTCEIIQERLGVRLFSIFKIRDILPILPIQERAAIIDYLGTYGSRSVMDYIRQGVEGDEPSPSLSDEPQGRRACK